LRQVALRGEVGKTYHLASERLTTNLDLVGHICDTLDRLVPAQRPRRELMVHVADRPGHDRRYALDAASAHQLGWRAITSLEEGLEKTVRWYLEQKEWVNEKLAVLASEREGREAITREP
jgi:dTDP-glucose 4,6-dehydratase